MREISALVFFFFNDTATTEIYTLSLHDALPISQGFGQHHVHAAVQDAVGLAGALVHVHAAAQEVVTDLGELDADRKSTRLNSSHLVISYAVFCLKKKTKTHVTTSAPVCKQLSGP